MDSASEHIELSKEEMIPDYGLVSIIMPCYNAADYIKASIDSVVAQTYRNWELIIVDDCSTDISPEIIRQQTDSRIRMIENSANCGAAVSRNKAIEAAAGRWIAFLDSDDLWEQDKLSKQLQFMTQADAPFSFTHYSVLNNRDEWVTDFTPAKDVYSYTTILKHCYIGCSTVIYDRERLGKVYMPADAAKREDFACWLSILRSGVNATCFHECLTTYRVHSNSVSSNKFKMARYQWNVYRKTEKLSWLRSLYYMAYWAVLGVLKYK